MRAADRIVLLIALLAIIALASYFYYRAIEPVPTALADSADVDISREPIQTDLDPDSLFFLEFGSHKAYLQAVASYDISGILVGKRHYAKGISARLSPWDYALAWAEVTGHLDQLEFDQVVRFCLYKYKPGLTLSPAYVESHMSNNHLIPATKNLRKALRQGKKGRPVRLSGYLVKLWVEKGGRNVFSWNSSTSRDDRGNGACELVFVTRLWLDGKVYD